MSVVYLAERVDGGFTQEVAVKILDAPLRIDEVRQRFLAERQILARFAHPNIVSFLDAGVTADGRPYLVMERVDGQPLTRYCATRRLELPARLALLGQLCRAVQYAHQHGVVHRDLKPANVLVTPDGVVKVLDFGIAKLLDDSIVGNGDATVAGAARALTPSYASPEQLRGDTVTTATDIYTIGVVMYELLSGRRPYDAGERTLGEIVTLVANTTPARPSAAGDDAARPIRRGRCAATSTRSSGKRWRRRRRTATHRRSRSRTISSVTVAGEPIEARRVSITYVLARLARRHRAAVVASTVSLAALVVALGVSVWQTRAARLDRDRAERRFNDARELAHTLIFKVHDAVQPLPGSTPVRQMIVADALTYLERLSTRSVGRRWAPARIGARLPSRRRRPGPAVVGQPRRPRRQRSELSQGARPSASDREGSSRARGGARAGAHRSGAGHAAWRQHLRRGRHRCHQRGAGRRHTPPCGRGDDEEAERLVASAHFQLALAAPHDAGAGGVDEDGRALRCAAGEETGRSGPPAERRPRREIHRQLPRRRERVWHRAPALCPRARDRSGAAGRVSRAGRRNSMWPWISATWRWPRTTPANRPRPSTTCRNVSRSAKSCRPRIPRTCWGANAWRSPSRVSATSTRALAGSTDALDALRKSVAIYEEVAPLDAHSRRELSATLSLFGPVERQTGRKGEACRDFRRAATLTDALLAEHALTSMTARMQDDRRWIGKALAGCAPN